jgi:small neutral amino acid transporter SnatA (MarC family)
MGHGAVWIISSWTAHLVLPLAGFWHAPPALATALLRVARHPNRRADIYNILWAVVFGFATLNILSLAARQFEPNRRGLTFGELMAVLIVLLSFFLLGWELLSFFHIFPIKLHR